MMWERSIPKIKPQTESRRESTGTGRYGHVRNISRSMIDGDFSNANSQPESTDARKDQLQVNAHCFSGTEVQNFSFFFDQHSKVFILQNFDMKGSLEESSAQFQFILEINFETF